ncbi:MAG: sodium:proton antiporter NhaD [Bacteroidetes bacterium]|nr:sodium:proton antiporter NhaD [Bacteroidota bacterium]MCB9044317.1 sodium:proton antiporter NhaD [Chitinophagales bacterium]
MTLLLILIFVLGYIAIAFEHPLHLDKTPIALLTGMLLWAVLALGGTYLNLDVAAGEHGFMSFLDEQLSEHLFDISNILFFLLGAMTIVETVDLHGGFDIITRKVQTTNKVSLLWIIGVLAFFMSSVLDNLTTTIVMVSLLLKLISDRKLRLYYVGMVVIAANAGGAWTPIGDVTTTMLWIGGQVTTMAIIKGVFLPSIVCLVVPLLLLSTRPILKGKLPERETTHAAQGTMFEKWVVLLMGLAALIFVPIFKTVTHLPPFMGMLMGLAIVWITVELIHFRKNPEQKSGFSVVKALTKIDVPSVLFFLGILLAVSALEVAGILGKLALSLDHNIGNYPFIVVVIGVLSSIIDNVPLVAACMGMYPVLHEGAANATPQMVSYFAQDGMFWEFMAYCAGTGGSLLIIGSAAGVAAMGIERIDFIWYFKNMTWLAAAGYFAGAAVYLLLYFL